MILIYQPCRPHASPLWQIVHHGWDSFLAGYEQNHRKSLGPLRTGTIATDHTFGDYLIFHPHLHILREHGLISPKKLNHLLAWKRSGFNIDNGGEEIIAPHDTADRERLAQYLLRHPLSLQKITWNATTQTVIYRSKRQARDMRPLWRDLILQVWGGDPLQCPCCKGTMKPVRKHLRPGEVEFFLRLYGLWEGVIHLPRPSPPPFDIETMEPIEPPWQAIKEWIPDDEPDLNWI